MKIPRDIGYIELINSLKKFGYTPARQSGSHIRLTAKINGKTHNITIPAHKPIKIGTLNAIINELSNILEISKAELIKKLFG